jgi:uncharacterized SAM-binding protein YcdF (DUF218 family)
VRALLVLLVVLLLALAAGSAVLFVWPREDEVAHADAIVVLAGNFKDRLPEGRRLWERGVAPTLVLSVEPEPDYPRALCRRPRVVCFEADPYSTSGEAETLAPIARRRGWKSILLVTSVYHVTRARMLFGRCVAGKVYAVGVDEPALELLHGIVWEWPKLGYAVAVKRAC